MDSPSSVQAEPPVDHQAGLSSAGKTELPFQLQPETDFEVQTDSKGESLLESFPGTAEENEGGNRVRAILSTAAAVKEEAALVGKASGKHSLKAWLITWKKVSCLSPMKIPMRFFLRTGVLKQQQKEMFLRACSL